MRRGEGDATCVISGFGVDDSAIGPTPSHWEQRKDPSPAARHEAVLVMCASLLGDVFGWGTLRLFACGVPELCLICELQRCARATRRT